MSPPSSLRCEPSCEIPKVRDWETDWRRPKLLKAGEPRIWSKHFKTGSWALALTSAVLSGEGGALLQNGSIGIGLLDTSLSLKSFGYASHFAPLTISQTSYRLLLDDKGSTTFRNRLKWAAHATTNLLAYVFGDDCCFESCGKLQGCETGEGRGWEVKGN